MTGERGRFIRFICAKLNVLKTRWNSNLVRSFSRWPLHHLHIERYRTFYWLCSLLFLVVYIVKLFITRLLMTNINIKKEVASSRISLLSSFCSSWSFKEKEKRILHLLNLPRVSDTRCWHGQLTKAIMTVQVYSSSIRPAPRGLTEWSQCFRLFKYLQFHCKRWKGRNGGTLRHSKSVLI